MKKYIILILILFIPLLIITIYSFCDEISFWGITIEKAKIASYFEIKVQDSTLNNIEQENKIKKDTIINDTNKQRILFFGDSMLEGLGNRMRYYASENGHELCNIIWYSSTTRVWGENIDTLKYFIKDFKPSYIFICLGANELFVKDLEKREECAKVIISCIDTIPFIWIGPPNWKDDTGINDIILRNAGKKRYFPSKRLTYSRASDGAHPTRASANMWLDSVAVWIKDSINHRILMNKPQDGIKPKGNIIVLQPLQ